MIARDIIGSAYQWLNRLSPGETLSADDAAFALSRLNDLVDEMSADALFLFQDLKTSAVQTGHVTLGTGSWAAIPAGSSIVAVAADGYGLAFMLMDAYITLAAPTTAGSPSTYTPDGASTVYFYPVPNGQTITIQTRKGVTAFADLDTDYTAPPGYKSALGVMLAIRCAPTLLGGVPAPLVRAERRARNAIQSPRPAIVDVPGFAPRARVDITTGAIR